jgi:hypothetical protein
VVFPLPINAIFFQIQIAFSTIIKTVKNSLLGKNINDLYPQHLIRRYKGEYLDNN